MSILRATQEMSAHVPVDRAVQEEDTKAAKSLINIYDGYSFVAAEQMHLMWSMGPVAGLVQVQQVSWLCVAHPRWLPLVSRDWPMVGQGLKMLGKHSKTL